MLSEYNEAELSRRRTLFELENSGSYVEYQSVAFVDPVDWLPCTIHAAWTLPFESAAATSSDDGSRYVEVIGADRVCCVVATAAGMPIDRTTRKSESTTARRLYKPFS
jgi:hypothetical protein